MMRTVFALALAGVATVAAKSCRALAMSGGGSKGSYEAGALWGMYFNAANGSDYAYDVSTGVSAGALNTGALAVFAPGDEENMLEFLSQTWQNISQKDVYKHWKPLGPVTGIRKESGILNDQPLVDYLTAIYEKFDYVVKRKIAVSCVDVNSGDYVVFFENTTEPVKAIVSSASIPFVFPHQTWKEEGVVCMDGGTVWNTNLVSAVERCREQVDDDSEITLDIVLCSRHQLDAWEDTGNTWGNFLRYRDIRGFNDDMNDIFEFKQAYPNVTYRHLVIPSEKMPSGMKILDMDNATSTWPMQMLGRKDGENILKSGDGFYFDKMDQWKASPELQASFPKMSDYIETVVDSETEKYSAAKEEPVAPVKLDFSQE